MLRAVIAGMISTPLSTTAEAGRIIWSQPELLLEAPWAVGALGAADLDADGDVDVVIGYLNDSGAVPGGVWMENDRHPGTVTFKAHDLDTDFSSFLSRPVRSIQILDLLGDGRPDVLMGAAGFAGGRIYIYENLTAVSQGLERRRIDIDFSFSAIARDLDNDGLVDLISANPPADRITLFLNDGSDPPDYSPLLITDDPDGPFTEPGQGFPDDVRHLAGGDLDGDGDVDLLSASFGDDTIAWYENDGTSPPAFHPREISTIADGAVRVVVADFDGDGDLDVASASRRDDRIAWYENDGGRPPGFVEHVISVDPDGRAGPLEGFSNGPQDLIVADLDRDGDPDLLATSAGDERVAWYDNAGGSPPPFIPRSILTGYAWPGPVIAADLDGDGDLDVAVGSTQTFPEEGPIWIESRATLPHGKGGRRWRQGPSR